jgi:hypothetical protein
MPLSVFAVLAIYVLHSLLLRPGDRILLHDPSDQTTMEWFLTEVAQRLAHLHNPLFSTAMGPPNGLNVMANPSMPLYGVLMTPVTLLFGAGYSFAFLLAFNLFATATGWYWFFLRHPRATDASGSAWVHRLAAALGGGLCGFSAAMLSHTNGHPNLTGQWLIPLIADRFIALRGGDGQAGRPRRSMRAGATLGLLVALQLCIAEELVFIAALTLAIVAVFHVAQQPRRSLAEAPGFAKGLGAALGTAGVLLAYPLWYQFDGPRAYTGFPWPIAYFGANLHSYVLTSQFTVSGSAATDLGLVANVTEESAFVGIPLLALALGTALWLVHERDVRTVALAAATIIVLSLGVTGPWKHLETMPVFSQALPIRLSFAVFPLLAYLLVTGLRRLGGRRELLPRLGFGAVAAALAFSFPLPLATTARPAVPSFYADGLWRQCVRPGHALLALPLGYSAMRWQTDDNDQFSIVAGSFFGPADGSKRFQEPTGRFVGALFTAADKSGAVPPVTPAMRAEAAADLAYWHADCVALYAIAPTQEVKEKGLVLADQPLAHPSADRRLLDALFGPGTAVAGVWIWRAG